MHRLLVSRARVMKVPGRHVCVMLSIHYLQSQADWVIECARMLLKLWKKTLWSWPWPWPRPRPWLDRGLHFHGSPGLQSKASKVLILWVLCDRWRSGHQSSEFSMWLWELATVRTWMPSCDLGRRGESYDIQKTLHWQTARKSALGLPRTKQCEERLSFYFQWLGAKT